MDCIELIDKYYATSPELRHILVTHSEQVRNRALLIIDAHPNLPRHALVAERHTGSGITMEQVIREDLPIPVQDYLPVSLEERIICYADKFYSKSHLGEEVALSKIRQNIWKYGHDAILRWELLEQEMQ